MENVNLLNGLITADALTARARSTAGLAGARSDATGSRFTNLVIDDRTIAAKVAPNTRIELPGLGRVVLNEQTGFRDGTFGGGPGQHQTGLIDIGLHVQVTVAGNTLGLPVGADVVLVRASSDASA